MTSVAEHLLTADEFMRLPDDPSGGKMELVYGKVVTHMPPGGRHGALAGETEWHLTTYARLHGEGLVVHGAGFLVAHDPDLVREPDTAFVRASELPPGGLPPGYVPFPPTLAVEVVSPNDTLSEVLHKAAEYIAAGSARVWAVDPRHRTVTVFRPDSIDTRHEGDTLTSDNAGFATAGFALPLAELFAGVPREAEG